VPTYRVYYAELEPKVFPEAPFPRNPEYPLPRDYYRKTEWEEEVEAPNLASALDEFFKEHVRDNSELMWVGEDGEAHPVTGLDYDPEKTYIWMEEGKMMEYQGVDEATPGMVTCPLCGGEGEVDEELAAEFEEVWGEEEEE
jgi:hypothetical protein